MAIVTNPSFALAGSTGNLIFYQRNGVTCVRTKPVRYRDAQSVKQKTARGRFTGCNRFYDFLVDPVFRAAWKAAVKGLSKTGRNLFMQLNMHAFDVAGQVDDYSRLRLSSGMLPLPGNMRLECVNEGEWVLQWGYEPDKMYGLPGDRLYVFVVREPYNPVLMQEVVAVRSDGKAVLPIGDGVPAHVYCFFGNVPEGSFSNSVYYRVDGVV